ncbi:hypothetical protein [Delftia acidovorans]|uniref:hypothetical protein n=1 Tax=Delftia acidovorans TaxID=80866 RepID=UPI000BCAD0A9|nr:hypothetical protein [Delftia acidovorans]SOE35897.1 hypothetical protein SAMN05216519_1890 [Delftia acidovorans]
MHEELSAVCKSLDNLSKLVLSSWSENKTLAEAYGWHHPAITRHDVADIPSGLASKIRNANLSEIDENMLEQIKKVPGRLELLHSTTVPYIFNGNAQQALPAFMITLEWVNSIFLPVLGWQKIQDLKAMPTPMARRLRGIQADIDELAPNKERLEEQIRQIQDATDAAESLPADMKALKEARNTINRLSTESAELYGKIDERYIETNELTKLISDREREADKLVQQCEEAYRITTTKGLAAAFDQRAMRLGMSMWIWVFGLLCALAIGAYIGSNRVETLSAAIANNDPRWGVIWMNIALSVLSIGAPLWFAWISTKQIGQRFRLAEDYGFKASVAKAYEGYKREAARIDEEFEARLFSSALARLEEPPLRLVSSEDHGSPWHELISSDAFNKALSQVPELKEKFFQLSREGLSSVGRIGKKTGVNPPSSSE